MALFERFRKKTASAVPTAKAKASAKSPAKEKAVQPAEEAAVGVSERHLLAFRLLRKPHVSEKAARLADGGTYVFQVPVNAEKVSVKRAVEAFYKVQVKGVRTINYAGKVTQRGRRPGARKAWKKAIVTLRPGQKIDLYEGV